MTATYYKQGDHYIAVTGESPKGFKGVLLIGRGPNDAGDIVEQVYAVNVLRTLQPVALRDVPEHWVVALGYDEVYDELPVFDLEGEELLDLMPVPRRTTVKNGGRDLGCIIGLILFFLIWLLGWL